MTMATNAIELSNEARGFLKALASETRQQIMELLPAVSS